ncbi:MAG: hypothetical protein GY711_18760 [bacterium]|nr:hypothetical protein [bacterium]
MIATTCLAAALAGLSAAPLAQGPQESFGLETLKADASWPTGFVELVNRRERVYRYSYAQFADFYFRGDSRAVNETFAAFSKMDAEVLDVVLMPTGGRTRSLDGRIVDFNWKLTAPSSLTFGVAWFSEHPRLTVHVDGDTVKLSELELPRGVRLIGPDELLAFHRQSLSSPHEQIRPLAFAFLPELIFLPRVRSLLERGRRHYSLAVRKEAQRALTEPVPAMGLALKREQCPELDTPGPPGRAWSDSEENGIRLRVRAIRQVVRRQHGLALELSVDDVAARRYTASIVNYGQQTVTVVRPGDGSCWATRTPYIEWTTRDATTGTVVAPPPGIRACALQNAMQLDEIVTLEPGHSVDLRSWLGAPYLPGPGRFSVRLRYECNPNADRLSWYDEIAPGAWSRLRASTLLVLESAPIEITID